MEIENSEKAEGALVNTFFFIGLMARMRKGCFFIPTRFAMAMRAFDVSRHRESSDVLISFLQ
jgi:hypothetical protein